MDAASALGLINARQQTKLVRQLKMHRKQAGLTVDDLAKKIGVEPSFIIAFEKGGMNYTASTLRSIAKAVGAELQLNASKPGQKPFGSAWVESSQAIEAGSRDWSPKEITKNTPKTYVTTANKVLASR